MIRKKSKVAIVGMGSMGRNHKRNIIDMSDKFELIGFYDPAIDGSISIHELEDIAPTLDGVSICSPSKTHTEIARNLMKLNNKLKVLIEKPIDYSLESAKDFNKFLIANERSNDVLVGHIERFNPAIKVLRELLASGKIGMPVSIRTKRFGNVPSREMNNVAVDLAVHDVDICRFILGRPICRIGLVHSGVFGSNLVDSSCIQASVKLGSREVSIVTESNWITPVKVRVLEMNTTSHILSVDYISQTVTGYDVLGHTVEYPVEKSEPLRLEISHFDDMIQKNVLPACTVSESIDALELVS